MVVKAFLQLLLVCGTCFLSIAVVSLCAEVRHGRYHTGIVSLPCRDDHDRAYFASARWLAYCREVGFTTWLAGETHHASFSTPPELFPWTRRLHFAYAPQGGDDNLLFALPLPGWTQSMYVKVSRRARPPPPHLLETCTLGSLRNLQRLRYRDVSRSCCGDAVVKCARSDVLDCFRYPFRASDPFRVTYI